MDGNNFITGIQFRYEVDIKTGSLYGGRIDFINKTFSGVTQRSLSISPLGNVGINKANPTYKLDVDGEARFSSYVNIGSLSQFPTVLNAQGDFYKLAVAGGILTQEVNVKLNNGSWPDYVFSNSYVLPSLPNLEKYLKTYKHLPNTPSALELEEKGLELKSITVKQQQNIEELYLYIIEMNKRLSKLEEENITLKSKLIEDEK